MYDSWMGFWSEATTVPGCPEKVIPEASRTREENPVTSKDMPLDVLLASSLTSTAIVQSADLLAILSSLNAKRQMPWPETMLPGVSHWETRISPTLPSLLKIPSYQLKL